MTDQDWRKSAVRSLRLKAANAKRKLNDPENQWNGEYLYERAMWCDLLADEIEGKR